MPSFIIGSIMNTHVKSIFPVVLLWADVETFNKDSLIEYVYKQMEDDPEGRKISNQGGWQSDGKYSDFANPLRDFLQEGLKTIFDAGIYEKVDINVIQSWINVNRNKDSNILHRHSQSDLSGTFWINVPEKSGDLSFSNPHGFVESKLMENLSPSFKEQFGTYPTVNFIPVEGRICIWPSHLYHSVSPNMSNGDRISVAFNITVDG